MGNGLLAQRNVLASGKKLESLNHLFDKVTCAIHLYHSAGILESVGNKDFVFALSLHCLCPSSLTLNERFDGQNLWFGH